MSAVARALPVSRTGGRTTGVVVALARAESRRMLRNPVLWACAGLSVWMAWSVVPTPGEWSGASYEAMATCVVPLLFAVSVVTAASFHRERLEVSPEAPVPEQQRMVARLLAASPLLLVTTGYAAFLAWRQRDLGGLWLGMEPGRTTEALFTTGELAQPVALTVLAVATGAALGRRLPLVSTIPILFVLWFLASIYWLFGDAVTPLSALQVQPVRVFAGTPSADPLDFPAHWLLDAPHEFSGEWSRLVVSSSLGWWHAVWLVGLSALWVAVAVPRRSRARRWSVSAGSVLAVVGLAAQYAVLP